MVNSNLLRIRIKMLSLKTQIFFLKLRKRRAIAPLIIIAVLGLGVKVAQTVLSSRKKK